MNLSLPEECGGETVEEAVRLLSPYLSRINSLVMVGEESESAWQIEDYLYDEYGIVTSYARRPEKMPFGWIWEVSRCRFLPPLPWETESVI